MKRVIYLVILSIIIYSCQKFELLEHSNPLVDGRPFISTIKSDFITSTTAELHGEFISTGETPITLFGHCWSTSNTPTIENMYKGIENYTSDKYVISITELNPSTKYYFRAFATNSIETAYGEELSFTTNEAGEPLVITEGFSNITSTSVTLLGQIENIGNAQVTEHGHCWSISSSPTVNDSKTSLGAIGVASFTSNISDLTESTTYYYRAYATNSFGTVYGSSMYFSTNNGEPTVVTIGSSNVTASTVDLEGEITGIGDAPVIEHGHCWSISSSPTVNDSKTSLGAIGVASFTSNVSDLTQSTTYYYRAYATNSFGTVYGSSMYFSTNNGEPTVVTIGSSNVTASTVDLEGEITGIGDAPVIEHGHCWSISSSPTVNDSKTSLGAIGVASFTSNVSDLTQSTTYYYRAYATNSFGTVYGSSMYFSTNNGEPTVVTIGSSNVTASTVDLEGEITGVGDAPVTQHGHCWSTDPNPTIGDPYTTNGNASAGIYMSNANLLSNATTYYFRAYATNSFGTSYGSVLSFTTNFGSCNITGINSSNTPYDLTLIPSSNTFNFGDNITVNMYHPLYSAGQSSILLYENEVLIMNLCSYCHFTAVGSGNYQRTITLPSSGTPSNCYTIRVLGTSGNDPYLNISNPITIY